MYNPFFTGSPRAQSGPPRSPTPDRQEIIRKIKGQAPAQRHPTDIVLPHADSPTTMPDINAIVPTLLPSPLKDETQRHTDGLAITRSRSALHRGDFTHQQQQQHQGHHATHFATSPVVPWHAQFPKPRLRPDANLAHISTTVRTDARKSTVAHAPSPSGLAFKPPTSPLVHQSNAADIPDDDDLQISTPLPPALHGTKRHLSSPWPLCGAAVQSPADPDRSPVAKSPSMPSRAHQLRLSISSVDQIPSPRGSFGRVRRMSLSGGSPVQNSMVGSFEESILLGRMSSSPSVPLDFTAQIGVFGFDERRPGLKCPPHIIVPFPAVFYSYSAGNEGNKSHPSPYVGLIDLESRTTAANPCQDRGEFMDTCGTNPSDPADSSKPIPTMKWKARSDTSAPRGAYRIPAQGQLQVMIKNPNKTAVKLFLVPYDVSNMLPGQKTFIRQRSMSTNATGHDLPYGAIASATRQARPVMRYLIQLHICCPVKGRVYLHKSMRVVFANRVPDGKERLQNDLQFPEPRYSPYKADARTDGPGNSDPEPASKRRKSEVLPSSARRTLRLLPALAPQSLIRQPVEPLRSTEVFTDGASLDNDPSPWLLFPKRDITRSLDSSSLGSDLQSDISPNSTAFELERLIGSSNDSLLSQRLLGLGMHTEHQAESDLTRIGRRAV